MIRAVFFDIDDTLGNRSIYGYRLFRQLIDQFAGDRSDFEKELIAQDCWRWDMNGHYDKNFWKTRLLQRYGVNVPYDPITEWWNSVLPNFAVSFPDAKEVLDKLHKEGYILGCITNGSTDGQKRKLVNMGLDVYLDPVVVSQEAGVAKPDPKIFRIALEKAGVKAEESVFVGDDFHADIYGACRAGLIPVWMCPDPWRQCDYPIKRIKSLSELPECLKELSGKDRIV